MKNQKFRPILFITVCCSFFFLFISCEKVITVPENEREFAPASAYWKTPINGFNVDSIVIVQIATAVIFGEFPDLAFAFYNSDCNTCTHTFSQVVSDVVPSMLPYTIIPSSVISYNFTDGYDLCPENFIRIINHAPPVVSCTIPSQYIIGEINATESPSLNASSWLQDFYLEGLLKTGATSFTFKSNAVVVRFHISVS
jgi:hypothetical protein